MKRNVGFGIIVSLIILIIGVCGCTMNKSDLSKYLKSEVTLNERQKTILTELGLTTEYNDLKLSQQKAIVSIEEMLQYADDKYKISFSYAGYTPASVLEEESMCAYPLNGDKETDCFTIIKREDGYEDDYINIAANEGFSSYVCEGLKSICPDVDIRVYSEITNSTLDEIPDKSESIGYDGKIESSLWIFVDEATYKECNFKKLKTRISDFMKEHQLYGIIQVILLKEGKLVYLTKYNYTDYLSDDYYLRREMVYIK